MASRSNLRKRKYKRPVGCVVFNIQRGKQERPGNSRHCKISVGFARFSCNTFCPGDPPACWAPDPACMTHCTCETPSQWAQASVPLDTCVEMWGSEYWTGGGTHKASHAGTHFQITIQNFCDSYLYVIVRVMILSHTSLSESVIVRFMMIGDSYFSQSVIVRVMIPTRTCLSRSVIVRFTFIEIPISLKVWLCFESVILSVRSTIF